MADILVEEISEKLKRRKFDRRGLWHEHEDHHMTLSEAIELSLASLKTYGERYPHWAISYSGGKDSSALVAFVVWAIEQGFVDAPESLTVLYADTRMELPPLAITAERVLRKVDEKGYKAIKVLPRVSNRFWVKILGVGLPPPKQNLRWCTRVLKQEPMKRVSEGIRRKHGDKLLTLTGVRLGESSARDQRINASCSRNAGECGQGWFQRQRNALAPLLHWRVCWIWDFLNSSDNPLPETLGIAPVYVTDDITDIRTGCISCNIVERDWALEYLVKSPEYAHLKPLQELRPLYDEMLKPEYRLRRGLYHRADGSYSGAMTNSIGALTVEARKYFYKRVRDIENRASYTLINDLEDLAINMRWLSRAMPKYYQGNEIPATELYDIPLVVNGQLVGVQPAFKQMKE